jgi:type I restriction enzyme S subunit
VSDWIETTIGKVSTVFDGPHATPAKVSEGPVFLGISCLSRGRLDLAAAEHLSEHDFKRWTRRVEPTAGDVVFSYETRLGEVALIPPGLLCCLGRRMALIRPDRAKIDSRFLLYYYLSPEFQELIRSRTVPGSTVDRILLEEFPKFPIRVPDLATQREVASLLSALDDKIELNRRMNQTLESMARVIFRSWFVDFDPVVAKAEGRQPFGMSADVAALFPGRFQEAELGPLPNSWQVGTVKDCCIRVENGGTPRRDRPEFWLPAEVPWLTSAEVRQGIVTRTLNRISNEGLRSSSAKLWPRGTTVVALYGATAGQVCWLAAQMCANQACCGLIPRDGWTCYVYLHILSSVDALADQSRGSAQQNLSQEIVARFPTTLPSSSVVEQFEKMISPTIGKQQLNLEESRTLASLRDALLPKLMSGELRVRDAEKLAGAHA